MNGRDERERCRKTDTKQLIMNDEFKTLIVYLFL